MVWLPMMMASKNHLHHEAHGAADDELLSDGHHGPGAEGVEGWCRGDQRCDHGGQHQRQNHPHPSRDQPGAKQWRDHQHRGDAEEGQQVGGNQRGKIVQVEHACLNRS